MRTEVLWKVLKKLDRLEDFSVNERIIIKLKLNNGMDSSGLRNGPLSGSCDRGNHASLPKGRGIWLRDKHNRL